MHSITFIQQNLGGRSPFVVTETKLADIYFLQKVNNLTRPEIKVLLDRGYEIHGFPSSKGTTLDAVIAINQIVFKDIQIVKIHVEDRERIAAARTIHKASKQAFLLFPIHSPYPPASSPLSWSICS